MKYLKYLLLLTISIFLSSCSNEQNQNIELKGNAMGTFYFIKLIDVPKTIQKEKIDLEINKTLLEINKIVSNWDSLSEISLINSNKTLLPIKVSNELLNVFKTANLINAKSNGFFDITLDPIIDLWGFGYKEDKFKKVHPLKQDILEALSLVNQKQNLEINHLNNELIKRKKDVLFNLSAIGKGYGIDLIGKKLKNLNINNFLINIGGDILTKGYNSKKQDWVIGIENPNLQQQFIKEIINVTNKGVATSGDYKNFFDINGKKYSHIINPKSGMPINHSTKSVTVIEESAMLADGWATAFLAMGSAQGLKIAEKEKIAVIFIDKSEKKLIKITSNEFKKLK